MNLVIFFIRKVRPLQSKATSRNFLVEQIKNAWPPILQREHFFYRARRTETPRINHPVQYSF